MEGVILFSLAKLLKFFHSFELNVQLRRLIFILFIFLDPYIMAEEESLVGLGFYFSNIDMLILCFHTVFLSCK